MSSMYFLDFALIIAVASVQGRRCGEREFECRNESKCIRINKYCDGVRHCRDGSDEQYPSEDDHNDGRMCRRSHDPHALCILPPELQKRRNTLCKAETKCAEEDFECRDRSNCIPALNFCDGVRDCSDGSDEPQYATFDDSNETLCRGRTGGGAPLCILPLYLYDERMKLCRNGIHCAKDEIHCSDGSRCIYRARFCDGKKDCRDGSDEPYATHGDNGALCRRVVYWEPRLLCILPTSLRHIRRYLCDDNNNCSDEQLECRDGSNCLRHSQFCDGSSDCRDGSDESYALNEDNRTLCRRRYGNGRLCVLPSEFQHKRDDLCRSEINCTESEFECRDPSRRCIRVAEFCNGRKDCRDGSDEPYALNEDNRTLCRRPRSNRRLCVLPPELQHKRDDLCRSEINCSESEFECRDPSRRCIRVAKFCNGRKDCSDGSDEPHNTTFDNATKCIRKTSGLSPVCILPRYLEHDRKRLCRDGLNCYEGEFTCHDGSGCLVATGFCDGWKECRDGSDEIYVLYEDNRTLCRRATHKSKLCNLPLELEPVRESLCNNEMNCLETEFECLDGSKCHLAREFCNGIADCSDGSDEIPASSDLESDYRACFGSYSEYYGVGRCKFPKQYICDGAPICSEGIDECLCGENNEDHLDAACFRCVGHPNIIIPTTRLCDGSFDCPDLTDECLCQSSERPEICERHEWDGERHFLRCKKSNNSKQIEVDRNQVCDKNLDCNYAENERHCGGGYIFSDCWRINVRRNGFGEEFTDFVCAYKNAAQACFGNNAHCRVVLEKHSINLFKEVGFNSSRRWIGCAAKLQMELERNCILDYRCISVSYEEVLAQRRKESQKNSCLESPRKGERNCTYFSCDSTNNGTYIEEKAVCDGRKDCLSGVDECQPGCIISAFSDERSLITNKGVLLLVWMFSIFALIGCTLVVASTLHDIMKSEGRTTKSSRTNINKLLILSLAISDLLVGVYTMSICIKAVQVEGSYCNVDIEWRSSFTCSLFGALLIIGSEQSVLTMVLITVYRVQAIIRPLSRPNFKRAVISLMVSWTVSILFGLIPLIPSNEDYFLKFISFNDTSIFKTKVNQTDQKRIITWLSLMKNFTTEDNVTNTGWGTLRRLVAKINPSNPITTTHEFGYYSSHTVCLPTLFPDRKDKSWMYSFILLVTNFLAFVFMLICYVKLYRKASSTKALESAKSRDQRSKQSATMQRKLTRILVSDFLCWMPVCIMGFLKLAGINIPDDAYLPTGLLILPINSALNPFLYSNLPDRLLAQKSKLVRWLRSSLPPHRKSMDINVIEMDTSKRVGLDGGNLKLHC